MRLNRHTYIYHLGRMDITNITGYSEKIQLATQVIHDIYEHRNTHPKVLIYGLGYDSKMWWEMFKGNVFFVEQNEEYIALNKNIPSDHILHYTPPHTIQEASTNIHKFIIDPPEWIVQNGPYDLILVDGPTGYDIRQPGRLLPIAWLSKTTKNGTLAYVDDYLRNYEKHCVNTLHRDKIDTIFPQRNGCCRLRF
jgi:hypothetical protein